MNYNTLAIQLDKFVINNIGINIFKDADKEKFIPIFKLKLLELQQTEVIDCDLSLIFEAGKEWDRSGKILDAAAHYLVAITKGCNSAEPYIKLANIFKKKNILEYENLIYNLAIDRFKDDFLIKINKTISSYILKKNDWDLELEYLITNDAQFKTIKRRVLNLFKDDERFKLVDEMLDSFRRNKNFPILGTALDYTGLCNSIVSETNLKPGELIDLNLELIRETTNNRNQPIDTDRIIYDENGYDIFGFDKNGVHKLTGTLYTEDNYDREGYNKDGYDRLNFDKNGIHRFTDEKYDRYDSDKYGYDSYGYDKTGFNKSGYNKNGYDIFGYDEHGNNQYGINVYGNIKNEDNLDSTDNNTQFTQTKNFNEGIKPLNLAELKNDLLNFASSNFKRIIIDTSEIGINSVVGNSEHILEERGYKVRIITKTLVTFLPGKLIHTIATFNPDFEIKRNFLTGNVEILRK